MSYKAFEKYCPLIRANCPGEACAWWCQHKIHGNPYGMIPKEDISKFEEYGQCVFLEIAERLEELA